MDQEYAAPTVVSRSVLQRDWNGARERSLKDPEGFWAKYAGEFEWSQPWTKALEWDGVHHKWFVGAKTNITINALDRHASSGNANRAALSGSAKMAPSESSPTGNCIARSVASPTA